ncbi:MAG: right-handed parallel beta-helix repeat-containing protein [Cyclobacteriaceae bacterium]
MSRLGFCFAIVTFTILLFTLSAQERHDVYVSVKGNDSFVGSIESPFLTVSKGIQELSKLGEQDTLCINLMGGVYHFSQTLNIHQSIGAVILKNYNKEEVVFHGGRFLDGSGFQNVSNKKILNRLPSSGKQHLIKFNLKEVGIDDFGELKQHGFGIIPEPTAMELFINGQPQNLARYPNSDELLMIGKIYDKGSVPRDGDFTNRGAEFGFEYDRALRWKQAQDIWLHGKFSFGYNDDHLKIKSINYEKGSFDMTQPHLYGVTTSTREYIDSTNWRHLAGLSVRGYYAYNLLEEIDQPGEYYLDRRTGDLYLYPPTDLSNSTVEVSIMEDPLVVITDTKNVTLEGITFTCSRGMGVYLENSGNIRIHNCEFSNLGTVGISMGQKLQNNRRAYHLDGSPRQEYVEQGNFEEVTISDCMIFNTGTGGVILSGGDRLTLTPGNNGVYNTDFYNTDRINHAYSPAIKLYGVSNIINHCYFHDLRHQAIAFMGNDHLIEYNRFDEVCTEADDMGAIYTGRDPSSRGTTIRYNYFSNIEPEDMQTSMAGVYIDDGSGGIRILNNLFYKVGNPGHYKNFAAVFCHGGSDNEVNGNTFLDCKMAVGQSPWNDEKWSNFLESKIIQYRLLDEVDILNEAYQHRYPQLKDYFTSCDRRLNLIKSNVLVNTPLTRTGDFMIRENRWFDYQKETDIDPYNIRDKLSPIELFPFEQCGLKTDE